MCVMVPGSPLIWGSDVGLHCVFLFVCFVWSPLQDRVSL